MPSYPIIDYFSFSIPMPCLFTQWEISDQLEMGNLFDDRTHDLLQFFSAQKNWRDFNKGGLFNRMVRFDDVGCTFMEGDKCEVSLVQFSGEGCKYLRDNNLLDSVLGAWYDRATRIDLAFDMVSDADPEDFARKLSNKRFKTDSHEKSNTGITWYVGSYKSDRFARVYRYSDKLKRNGALRLEYQFSGNASKHAAEKCFDEGVLHVVRELGDLYGWLHPDYDLQTGGAKYESAPRPKTRAGKELWLYNQVLPSLIKEAQRGNVEILIDLKDKLCAIIDEYVSFTGD